MGGSGVASRRGKSQLETLICICIMLCNLHTDHTKKSLHDKNLFRHIEL